MEDSWEVNYGSNFAVTVLAIWISWMISRLITSLSVTPGTLSLPIRIAGTYHSGLKFSL